MRQRWSAVLPLILLSVVGACGVKQAAPPPGDPTATLAEGWTELTPPPEVRQGATLAWTGSRVIAWGGCRTDVEDECVPTRDGFSFDPSTGAWAPVADGPVALAWGHAEPIGDRIAFLFEEGPGVLAGAVLDPPTGTWRRILDAPIEYRRAAMYVWTGSELIVWGGGSLKQGLSATGAAYDPALDSWRRIADAPVGLNLASGVWTGSEMLVFGSLLDNRNWAETRTSVGAAYDPDTDTWRALPPSHLSPQATSADWVGSRMVAWDYEARWQAYDPATDGWTTRRRMPMEPSECYPISVMAGEVVFAFFCGQAAVYDPAQDEWRPVRGGMLRAEIEGPGESTYKEWRFATMAAADDVVFLLAEGITIGQGHEVCYGCEGSPHSFWAYRPEAT